MFSYEELTEGYIVYAAGSSSREADTIHVQLSDGVHVQDGGIHISIIRPSSSRLSSSRQSLDSASGEPPTTRVLGQRCFDGFVNTFF